MSALHMIFAFIEIGEKFKRYRTTCMIEDRIITLKQFTQLDYFLAAILFLCQGCIQITLINYVNLSVNKSIVQQSNLQIFLFERETNVKVCIGNVLRDFI